MSRLRDRTQPEVRSDIDLLLPALEDLHRQATEDRSHYYTGSLLAAVIQTLIAARYWLGPQPQPPTPVSGRKPRSRRS
jgi:hypothetical protein